MVDRDDLELRLATTLAPMLLTLAVFALGGVTVIAAPDKTIVDELLSLLAAFCIFAAALLVDSALDKIAINWIDRLRFLGGGYLCFCLVVGAMTTMTPILYEFETKRIGLANFTWEANDIPFALAGASVFLKMISYRDRQVWTALMIVFYSFSIWVLCR